MADDQNVADMYSKAHQEWEENTFAIKRKESKLQMQIMGNIKEEANDADFNEEIDAIDASNQITDKKMKSVADQIEDQFFLTQSNMYPQSSSK